jgi:stress response protein SCP2
VVVQLVNGQNVPWTSPVVAVEVQHGGDVSALLLTATGRVRSSGDLAFHDQPGTGAVRWSAGPPQQVRVDLAAVDPDVVTVAVVVSTDPGTPPLGAQPAPVVRLLDGAQDQVAGFVPQGLTTERALVVVEVYRRGATWKVRAVGQGYDGGLAQALTAHGVAVDQHPAEPATLPPDPPAPDVPRAPSAASPSAPAPPQPPPPPGTSPQERLVRQSAGVLEDASRSTASLRSTLSYAADRLERRLEELVADPTTRVGPQGDAARSRAQAEHDAMVAEARRHHQRDVDHLVRELDGLEHSLPAPMARWDSPAWTAWQPAREHAVAVRIGTLGVDDAPTLQVPMLVGLPLRTPVWVDTATAGPAAAAQVMRAVAVRVLAGHPPGTLRVLHLDVGSTNPAPLHGTGTLVSDPAGVTAALDDLVRRLDLVRMAVQSGQSDALAELGGHLHLVLVHDVPTGFDDRALALLRHLVDDGGGLGVQLVLTGADSEAAPNPLVSTLLRACRRVPGGPGGVLVDGFGGTAWDFTPDLGPVDQSLLPGLLPRLSVPDPTT